MYSRVFQIPIKLWYQYPFLVYLKPITFRQTAPRDKQNFVLATSRAQLQQLLAATIFHSSFSNQLTLLLGRQRSICDILQETKVIEVSHFLFYMFFHQSKKKNILVSSQIFDSMSSLSTGNASRYSDLSFILTSEIHYCFVPQTALRMYLNMRGNGSCSKRNKRHQLMNRWFVNCI